VKEPQPCVSSQQPSDMFDDGSGRRARLYVRLSARRTKRPKRSNERAKMTRQGAHKTSRATSLSCKAILSSSLTPSPVLQVKGTDKHAKLEGVRSPSSSLAIGYDRTDEQQTQLKGSSSKYPTRQRGTRLLFIRTVTAAFCSPLKLDDLKTCNLEGPRDL